MPTFRVVIETREGYERYIQAENLDEARLIAENCDAWGDQSQGWYRTHDNYCGIVDVEELPQGDGNEQN